MPRKRKDDGDELLNRQQVAEMFHISTKTVTRRVQARLLPPPLRGVHHWTRNKIWDHIEKLERQKRPPKKTVRNKKVSIQGERVYQAPEQRRGNAAAFNGAKAKR